jgi:hypothetical protein
MRRRCGGVGWNTSVEPARLTNAVRMSDCLIMTTTLPFADRRRSFEASAPNAQHPRDALSDIPGLLQLLQSIRLTPLPERLAESL